MTTYQRLTAMPASILMEMLVRYSTGMSYVMFNSRLWLNRLKEKIVEAKEKGEAVWITII